MESLLLLMFTVRETTQESTGFSPAELVFGHTVRGPLKLLKEQLVSKKSSPTSVLEYVHFVSDYIKLAKLHEFIWHLCSLK